MKNPSQAANVLQTNGLDEMPAADLHELLDDAILIAPMAASAAADRASQANVAAR